MKIAYFCEPQIGGTFTFYQRLAPALAARGVEMRCVSPISSERFVGTRFENAEGVDFLSLPDYLPSATARVIEHLERAGYDAVMTLPAADLLSSNLPPYLPRQIRASMRIPMMTRGAYAPARAVAPHLNGIVAVSDRIRDDLVTAYGISPNLVKVIWHGVEIPTPCETGADEDSSGPLKLLYVGRLWDIDKGVFLLPPMMRYLKKAGVDARLIVVGDGPDADELRSRFARARVSDRVTMKGALSLEEAGKAFRNADVFVFPSRFEGCGFAVLEAMAAGCAPVVSDIRGSLRTIVDDGRAGILARVGDAADFARAVTELARDRALLARIKQSARARAQECFSLARMADAYASYLRSLLDAPDTRAPRVPLDRYVVPSAMRPTWRTWIPRPIKNWLRAQLERRGIST